MYIKAILLLKKKKVENHFFSLYSFDNIETYGTFIHDINYTPKNTRVNLRKCSSDFSVIVIQFHLDEKLEESFSFYIIAATIVLNMLSFKKKNTARNFIISI